MFNKGNIIVRLDNNDASYNYGNNKNDIWKIKEISGISNQLIYKPDGRTLHKNKVRFATENEIKWFNLGITNVNQIPEVDGTFNNCIITKISDKIATKYNGYFTFKYWVENYKDSYKPPIKSNSERDVMFGKDFTIADLNNCKICNLTPEDHRIIQPFLFQLGYTWQSGSRAIQFLDTETPYLFIKAEKVFYKRSNLDKEISYFKNHHFKEIKKEVILNYINNQKQLNTNTNEILRQTEEVTRGQINGTARVVSGRQQITTGSRPKGNIQRVKIRKTQVRKFEILGKVRFR